MGTRIVVMKDGFIQQVDDPTNLYLHPNNTFVAGFIGMPPMNFLNGKIEVENGQTKLKFSEVSLTLPEKYSGDDVTSYNGKDVIIGIRPEAITDDARFVSQNPETAFPANVEVVEMLGAETYLYVTVAGTYSIIARVDPTISTSKVGDVTQLAVDGNRVHLFDRETEKVILS